MPLVSAAEFSRLAGVSKVAVSKAPDSTVHKEPDGKIDTDHTTNVAYLNTPRHGRGPAPEKTKPPAHPPNKKTRAPKESANPGTKESANAPKNKPAPEPVDLSALSPEERKKLAAVQASLESSLGEAAALPVRKMREDVARIVSVRLLNEFKLAASKKNVISREEFRRVAEEWNAKLGQNVMRVPRRVISRLWSMAKAGDDARSGEDYLERELSKAVTRALEGVASAK